MAHDDSNEAGNSKKCHKPKRGTMIAKAINAPIAP
jgi:hypothetical protein